MAHHLGKCLDVTHLSGCKRIFLSNGLNILFVTQARPCQTPSLLILDGHSTHTKNLAVIDLARENAETLVLPPHCSHRLQPLDVSFMKPLSTFYNQECEKWLRSHPERVITMFQIGEVSGLAYITAATPEVAIS